MERHKAWNAALEEEDEAPPGSPATTATSTPEPPQPRGADDTEWKPKRQKQDNKRQDARGSPAAKTTLTMPTSVPRPGGGLR
jgi:hypothetical protein